MPPWTSLRCAKTWRYWRRGCRRWRWGSRAAARTWRRSKRRRPRRPRQCKASWRPCGSSSQNSDKRPKRVMLPASPSKICDHCGHCSRALRVLAAPLRCPVCPLAQARHEALEEETFATAQKIPPLEKAVEAVRRAEQEVRAHRNVWATFRVQRQSRTVQAAPHARGETLFCYNAHATGPLPADFCRQPRKPRGRSPSCGSVLRPPRRAY